MALTSAERERRGRDRSRRRIPVRYGPDSGCHLGYTSDLGEKGLFLQGNTLYPPNTILHLTMEVPEGVRGLRGIVRWVKEVPQAFRRNLRGGMGVELLRE